MLEILCPILLVLVGCLVVQIDIFKDSEPITCNSEFLSHFGDQIIYYSSYQNAHRTEVKNYFDIKQTNVTSDYLEVEGTNEKASLIDFIKKLYKKEKDGNSKNNYGSIIDMGSNFVSSEYNFIQVVNGRARQSPMLYSYVFLNQILKANGITFNYVHYPLPTTYDNKSNSKALNNFCLVFFVSIAFSLIPANFISSIVSERINNSKHLMRISGVSIFAYWLINFFFELVKYYFTAGICLLILWAFSFVPSYLYIFYLLYGPPMISITYFFSFLFNSEAAAQNFVILFNLVIGSLGSTVVIMLRSLEQSTNAAKIAAYILRIIPSFAFGYGYNLLLNGKLIMFMDYSIEYLTKPNSLKIALEYAGSDALFLGATFVVYMAIVTIIEIFAYSFSEVDDGLIEQSENVKLDKNVQIEIDKVNEINRVKKVKNNKDAENGGNTDKMNLNDFNDMNCIEDVISNNSFDSQNKTNKRNNKKEIIIYNQNNILHNTNNALKGQNEVNYTNINKDDYSVKIKNMQKIYNNNSCISKPTIGVKNISFTVDYGECFGLLGLNGAGKTTIFKAITEEHAPTHGSIYINGLNILKNFDEVKLMFGYCPQFDAIFPYMTVRENLEFYSKIKGVDPDKLSEIIRAMIESMTLTKYTNKLAGRLSGGNKRKLSVAISMICNPPIVLLDEPSTGMDPEARRFMWAVIHKLTSKGNNNSVIMTTHSMDEAETLCRRMGIMVNGEFVCMGTANYIKESYGYGFEIDVRIKPIEQHKLHQIIQNLGVKRNHKITSINEAKEILKKIRKQKYCDYLNEESIGRKIYNEIIQSGNTSIQTLINWTRYVTCAMKMISVVLPHFNEIILSEFIENNFLFKIKKSQNSKTIGFLFSLLEAQKESCEITEYSIQQTSLEQIFNKFAENQGKTEEDIKNEKEVNNDISITSSLVHDLIQ
jgi:ABC-type multidrug transport system ATPase subunit